jgi:Amt family ammonium transporter
MIGVLTMVTTTLSGSAGALTWSILDYIEQGHLSAIGFCSDAVAGLISIVPAAGFICPTSSLAFGILGASSSRALMRLLSSIPNFEDTLDILAMHGASGALGNILTVILVI